MKKVLVVWYDYFHYLSSIVKAFNENENVHAEKFALEYFNKQANCCERALDAIGVSCLKKNYHGKVKNALIDKCIDYKPDLVLFLNANYREVLDESIFCFLQANKIKSALWFVDSVKNIDAIDEVYLKHFGAIYSFEYSDIKYLKATYKVDAKYLPLGAATDIYKKMENAEKLYDICFVGANDHKRLELLECIAEHCVTNSWQMIVYGHMWKHRPVWTSKRHECKFKNNYPNLYRFVVNRYLIPEDVAKLYSQSKICLNIIRSAHSGANPRTFEILATNSFQMVDYSKNIEILLQNGKHLLMYKDARELKELITYYLKNDKERNQIASGGYDITMSKYSLTRLVDIIVRDMGECMR